MPHDTPSSITQVDWRTIHAWGLPSGSIRARLAILIFGTVWVLLLVEPGAEIPDYLRDLLFVIMGHYFAARHRASQDPEPGPPPLFLPRGSVRVLLIAGSVAVAMLLFRRGQLTSLGRNPGVVTLLLVMIQVVTTGGIFAIHGTAGLEQIAWFTPSRWGFAAA